eukprot:jgi/Phyca11/10218/fgenesh1_pm.PHYCAscaffold_47_\
MDMEVKREPKLEPGLDESEKPPVWEDAYARHFTLVLSTILFEREDFRELLSPSERAIASRFLTELKPFEQQLYARLFQRQGPWFKTTSLFRYFRQSEDVKQELQDQTEVQEQLPVNEQVQDVIHVMIEAGFLQKFPVAAAVTPKSIRTIASKEERPLSPGTQMKQEMIRLDTALDAIERCATAPELATLYKKMTGSKKHVAKADLMAVIRKVAKTQKRIDGSRIPVAQLMQQIWLENYPLKGRKSSDAMALRMTPETRDLLLRMHRLFYFVSTPPFNVTSLMPPQLEDMGQLIGLAAHKLRQEPTQWPGLMVFFKKVAYPEYALTTFSSDDSTPTEMFNSHRIFPSSEVYVSYEVAYQLHRITSVVEQCIQIVTPEKEYQEPDLELKWMISDSTPVFLAFQRLLLILYEDEESTETEDEYVPVASAKKMESNMSADWQLRSWEQFYGEIEKMQSLDDLVLACRGCLQAYLKWMKAAAYNTSGIPAYFSKCNAGYHLVRSLHTAVGLYEKMRKYQISTLLLNELLGAPFLERKRGYWWDRLALNLEHLKCSDQARDACVNALEDPHVLAADRIALQRRLNRLERQRNRGETIPMESLPTADLLLHNTGNSMITPSLEDNVSIDEANGAAHTSYEYRRNHIIGRPLNRQTGEKSRFVGYDDEPCTVEQFVLQYCRGYEISGDKLKTGGWYGVHSEGVVFGNLFGVLMWDVLYASIPDVFQTPFQSAPLDFGYADIFYETRRDLIERRLAQVKDEWTMEELLTRFVTRWNSEFGKVSRFVHWPTDGLASLQFHLLAIAAIERAQLASLLRYMATSKEFHQAQNEGSEEIISEAKLEVQPLLRVLDLLRDTKYAQLKVVEVKGPRDRLSDKQLLWLEVLSEEIGLDASVMHVEEPEKHAKRKKKEAASATVKSAPRKRQAKRRKA